MTAPGDGREDALRQIRKLAESHGLSIEDIAAELERGSDGESGEPEASLLGRILGMLGAIFLFAGIATFIGVNWDAMNSAARIIVTLGSGIVTFVLAVMADGEPRYARTAVPLYLAAAVLQPVGMLVAINEFSSGGDERIAALVVAGIMAAQQLLTFRSRLRSVLLFTSIFFGLWFTGVAMDLAGVDTDLAVLTLGASLTGLCVGLGRTRFAGVTPFWFVVGSVMFYFGLFELVEDTFIELIFLAAGCGGVFLSTVVRSRALLTVSTLAIFGYIAYFTQEHFLDSLGWPLVLMLTGVVLIALSFGAMRISRRYIDQG